MAYLAVLYREAFSVGVEANTNACDFSYQEPLTW